MTNWLENKENESQLLRRSLKAMSVEGKYKCSLIYSDEARGIYLRHNGILKMCQDENQLKGSMFPTFFWLDSPFRGGKSSGNEFSFTVHFATPCQQYSMDVKGTVEGDKITGTANNTTGNYMLEGKRLDHI
jgi:hypothetical protein